MTIFGFFRGRSAGMGKRTSNLAEVMHSSMKIGPYAVDSRLGTVESANAQMDKAEHLGKRKKRETANAIHRMKLYALDDVSDSLTKYAEGLSTKEWALAANYYCVALNPYKFLVYTRIPEEQPEIDGPRVRFLRVRLVTKTAGNFFSCTCSFPTEYKMPCRHIFRVVGKRSKEMFGMRWLLCFQHCFHRDGFEDANKTMKRMLSEEHRRDFDRGYVIKCYEIPNHLSMDGEFPQSVPGTSVGARSMSNAILQLGLLRYSYQIVSGELLVRGEKIAAARNQTASLLGMEINMSLSHPFEIFPARQAIF